MANLEENLGTSFSSTSYGHNIPVLLGIENYSIWATRMRFSLGGLQALAIIEPDPPPGLQMVTFPLPMWDLRGKPCLWWQVKWGMLQWTLPMEQKQSRNFGLVYTCNIMKKDGEQSLFFSRSWSDFGIPTVRGLVIHRETSRTLPTVSKYRASLRKLVARIPSLQWFRWWVCQLGNSFSQCFAKRRGSTPFQRCDCTTTRQIPLN